MKDSFYWMADILEKTRSGPRCKEAKFDVHLLLPKLRALAKEYGIEYNQEELVPSDNSLADSVYNAGFELFLDLGVLCLDTRRRITFEESEVKRALKDLRTEIPLGTGKDRINVYPRKVEDPRPPWVHADMAGGDLSTGEMYTKLVASYAMEPVADIIGCASYKTIEDWPILKNSPLEMYAAISEAQWQRKGVNLAGRPGMHILGPCIESAAATIAACQMEGGLRPTDGIKTSLLVSLKTEYNMLSKVMFATQRGMGIYGYSVDMIGGYLGGPETAAIAGVASMLALSLVNNATYLTPPVSHIRRYEDTGLHVRRPHLWGSSISSQAVARNTNIILTGGCAPLAGPGTTALLYDVAIDALRHTTNGCNLKGVQTTGSRITDHYTSLEMRLYGEVGDAIPGMKRQKANELINTLIQRHEKELVESAIGSPMQEVMDMKKMQPKDHWLQLYTDVKTELEELGLKFS